MYVTTTRTPPGLSMSSRRIRQSARICYACRRYRGPLKTNRFLPKRVPPGRSRRPSSSAKHGARAGEVGRGDGSSGTRHFSFYYSLRHSPAAGFLSPGCVNPQEGSSRRISKNDTTPRCGLFAPFSDTASSGLPDDVQTCRSAYLARFANVANPPVPPLPSSLLLL